MDNFDKKRKKDNLATAQQLKMAYAGEHGELNSAVQFIYHFYSFKRLNNFDVAELKLKIAVSDMQHFKMLCELMLNLGLDPIYACYPPCQTDFYWTAKSSYSNSEKKMLSDGVAFKLTSIADYKRIIKSVDDPEVENVICKILKDEKKHLRSLNKLLKAYSE